MILFNLTKVFSGYFNFECKLVDKLTDRFCLPSVTSTLSINGKLNLCSIMVMGFPLVWEKFPVIVLRTVKDYSHS